MTWEQYKKERYTMIREGKKCLPGRKETITKILQPDQVLTVEEILPLFCKKTGITIEPARANIQTALDKLVDKGTIVQVSPGYYRGR